MQFFLCEIVARLVAIYFCFDCGRRFWNGLVERKMEVEGEDILDYETWIFPKDEAPVRYWLSMGWNLITLAACVVVAIFGWWLPKT